MRTRWMSTAAVVASGVVALVGSAGPAAAGPPGTWTVISGGGVSNIFEPGMYRTADGTLHVAIPREQNGLEYVDVAHLSESGQLTSRTTAVDGWSSLTTDPELVGSPTGGLRMVFGGLQTVNVPAPYTEGYLYQSSSDARISWTLAPNTQPAVASPSGYASYGTGVTVLPDGQLVAAYPLNNTITYQVGAGAVQSFSVAQCCAYDVTLVQEGGIVYAAWSNNGTDVSNLGLFVRQIYPTLGPVIKAPGSSTNDGSVAINQYAAMAVRNGGGVYLAYCLGYPTCKSVALWKLGESGYLKVPGSAQAQQVAISPAPTGRLWIAWGTEDDVVRAVRTNGNAKSFGAVRTLTMPKKSLGVYEVGIEGTRGRADVIFNDSESIYHQQIFAGLTLTSSPDEWNGKHAEKVAFKVTDAGDAIKGATVKAKFNGHQLTCKTEANGVCKLMFPELDKDKITVTAKKSGFAPDEAKLTVH